ncbi:hypothetical protein RFM41_00600 [Mesorhizobium sp. VK25A]|uniref:Uncharacterized protein n=1 Tax=Mesorhizobium vachelliae TaxID=3072309 RepID=A0ABU5A1U6_9HYPH|nr:MULTISPECIES: hypothetical protein [unclassified Mesorhizobium]MDX8530233.1 hypothetical protein [Mesorhizobium sp. VK25D]MDX8542210.1 hypothetical protein [Mesorhizobium sp. VK25A]
MMPKSVKPFSDGIMLYLFDLETDSDFRSFDLKSSGSKRSRRSLPPESREDEEAKQAQAARKAGHQCSAFRFPALARWPHLATLRATEDGGMCYCYPSEQFREDVQRLPMELHNNKGLERSG